MGFHPGILLAVGTKYPIQSFGFRQRLFVGPTRRGLRLDQKKMSDVAPLKRDQQVYILLIAGRHGVCVRMNGIFVVSRQI